MPDVSECSICLDDLDNNASLVTEVACGNRHRFHEICFRRYTITQRNMNMMDGDYGTSEYGTWPSKISCPLCRNPINQEIVIIPNGNENENENEGYYDCKTRCGRLFLVIKLLFLVACVTVAIYIAVRGF
jgi:hypothetical protein